MTTILRVLCVILVWAQAKTQSQPEFPQSIELGATLEVNCRIYIGPRTLVWYKLDTGRKLQLLVSTNTRKSQKVLTHARCSVQSSESSSTLRVNNVTLEDAGTYYCGVMHEYDVSFAPGTEVLVVHGKSKPPASLLQTVVQSPDYISVQPGDSVTLKCSFTISNCPQDHISVTWKKKNSASEIVSWNSGTKKINCESQVNTGEASCVHNLTMTVSSADDGTYLCVVFACGNTLSGSGTKIQLHAQTESQFLQTAALGATVHVKCQIFSGLRTLVWYKLDSNRKLQQLASVNIREDRGILTNPRHSVQSSQTNSILSISNVTLEDAGTYFCGVIKEKEVVFAPGTEVVVQGKSKSPASLLQTVVQSPDYISVQPGDSVTLKCSFITSNCPQDHISVTWKKHSETISQNRSKKINCDGRANTGEASFVHNLTMTVSSADDGTYLCVVFACGHILLGSGSKIHLKDDCIKESSDVFDLSPKVFALTLLNIVLGVTVLVLLCVVCNNLQKQDSVDIRDESNQNIQAEDGVIYAKVNIRPSRAARERPFEETVLYSQTSHIWTLNIVRRLFSTTEREKMSTILTTLCLVVVWAQAKAQPQPEFFQTTTPGATFHVNCRIYRGERTLVWYKLDNSMKLHMVTSTNTKKGQNIYQDSRFSVQSSEKDNTLSVTNVTLEDSGIYFCGVINEHDVDFGQGTEVVVKEKSKPASLQTVVQSPDYVSVQPGDSVTLKCSFNTSNCPQDHISVTWKRNSSASDIISQIYGTKKIHCDSRANAGEASCVHNLTMTVSSADDGTYLCVVFACGNSLSGSGTKIQKTQDLSPNVIALIGSNAVVALVVFVLLWGIWRSSNKTEVDSCGHRSSCDYQPDDTLTYTAGRLVTSSRTATMKRRQNPDIYTQVWYRHCGE
ncbi:hypothetical protein WMY93_017262 [Mugilogobius chulae]|uniref:Ig-like domain-containing protein n=1 Tax=Mugilogobius chulae TaxID=88201 RepID=A0AAW0NSI9_9GOBI